VGQPGGPALLLIHGWSQSDLCWLNQVRGDLAETFRIVTFDLRGHGLSEKPTQPEHYADGKLWADDVAAVIDQTGLEQPTLVAWSYGGYIVADYLRAYGDARIGSINLVGAAVILRPPAFDHIDPGMLENAPEMCVPDLFANTAATQRFLRACTSRPLNHDELDTALAWNMVVPPAVRGALLSRELDGSDALASTSVPVLVTHGQGDAIILPSMAEHTLTVCPAATASWYDGVGHMPFWEAAIASTANSPTSRTPRDHDDPCAYNPAADVRNVIFGSQVPRQFRSGHVGGDSPVRCPDQCQSDPTGSVPAIACTCHRKIRVNARDHVRAPDSDIDSPRWLRAAVRMSSMTVSRGSRWSRSPCGTTMRRPGRRRTSADVGGAGPVGRLHVSAGLLLADASTVAPWMTRGPAGRPA